MNSLTKPSKNRDLGGIGADTPTAVASKPKKNGPNAHFPLPSAPKRTVQTFFSADSSSSEPQAALLRSYIGADEKKKQIITELMRRLAIDVKDELMKAAGGGLRAATQALSEWKNSK